MNLFFLIVLQLFGLLTLIPWITTLGLSFMAFDSPESTRQPGPYIFVGVIASYPIILLIAFIFAWRHYLHDNVSTALWLSAIPLILAIIAFWLIAVMPNLLK